MVLHEKQEDYLFDTLNENCNAAQDHALQLLMSCEIPVVTAFSSLSKGDCIRALRKHTMMFNKLEEAVFLSTMTDYVSCAFQNELFDVFNKGNKYYSLSTLLMVLGTKWLKFFAQLKASDLTYVQLRSLVSLLKRSVNRLADYRPFLKEALVAGEIKLSRIQSPSDFLSSTSVSFPHQLENERCSNSLASGGATVVTPRAAVATYVIKSQNSLIASNTSSPPVKSLQKVENENTLPSKLLAKRKYGTNITKYILRASENRVMHDKLETENTITEIIDIDAEISVSQRSQHLNTTVHQGSLQAVGLDSPSVKKQKLDELPTGKVNAFALLMKNSKSLKKKKNAIRS